MTEVAMPEKPVELDAVPELNALLKSMAVVAARMIADPVEATP